MSTEIKKSVLLSEELWKKIEKSMSYRGMDNFNQWARFAFMNEARKTELEESEESQSDEIAKMVRELVAEYHSRRKE